MRRLYGYKEIYTLVYDCFRNLQIENWMSVSMMRRIHSLWMETSWEHYELLVFENIKGEADFAFIDHTMTEEAKREIQLLADVRPKLPCYSITFHSAWFTAEPYTFETLKQSRHPNHIRLFRSY